MQSQVPKYVVTVHIVIENHLKENEGSPCLFGPILIKGQGSVAEFFIMKHGEEIPH